MSLRQFTNEIDRVVTGIEVQEAVDLVVAYLRNKHKFKTTSAAHNYWAALTDDEKIVILRQALES